MNTFIKRLIDIKYNVNQFSQFNKNKIDKKMSKQNSQVAFIPDNISNISSGKQKYNQDTSQKLQDSYISKLTKLQNNNIDHQNATDIHQIKTPISQNINSKQQLDHKQLVASIAQKIVAQNIFASFGKINTQKPPQKKFFVHRYVKQPSESSSGHGQIRRFYQYDNDNTYYQGKHTQTDVISEKQSFIEEEDDYKPQQYKRKNDKIEVHFQNLPQIEKNLKKNENMTGQDFGKSQRQTFHVTEVDCYDEFDTELGWLEHCIIGNNKYLQRQTNQLLSYNQAVLMEIEKVQLRTKIIQLEIQTNKLKIALRKSQSSKHINFSVDFKLNRPAVLKIPKKIDQDMRSYCSQLEKTVTKLRKQWEQNQKQLSLLNFYKNQFEKKVNYAYIYQEYLVKKARRQLDRTLNMTISNKRLKSGSKNKINFGKSINKSFNLTNSKQKLEKVYLSNSGQQTPRNENNESITSIAKRLKGQLGNKLTSPNKQTKISLGTKADEDYYSPNPNITKYKSTQSFVRSGRKQYETQNVNKTSLNKTNKSISNHKITFNPNHNHNNTIAQYNPKRISLTHHKQITQPTNLKILQIHNNQMQGQFYPLFNTPNRQKKHFYYQCQLYLKSLQNDYLINCQSEKQNILLTNQNGFRQRELLKMKASQVKNQILDTEVDIVAKQKDIKKQNSILKKQLELLQNQLFTKFNLTNSSSHHHKTIKSVKSPLKAKNILPDEYNLLYKQAQRRLKTFKSTTMLQSVSRPNIPKSPKKVQSQRNLQIIEPNKNKILSKDNNSQNSDTKTLKKDIKYESNKDKKLSKSPGLKIKRSKQKSNKFLNRFKTIFSSDDENNKTIKQVRQGLKQNQKLRTQQKTLMTQIINAHEQTPRTQFVSQQYYAV